MHKIPDLIKIIRQNKVFLISTHQNPDADAVASALAMAMMLQSMGKKAHVLNEDKVPAWLAFLPKTSLFKRPSEVKPFDYDAAIVLDCGDLKRIGNVAKLLKAGKPIINIDHHITNDLFGSCNYVVYKASSTCEVLYDVCVKAKVKLDKNLAVLLYAGIMTDTGSFRYDNTSSLTHEIAARLMSYGINAQKLYDALYVGVPVVDMKLFTDVIHQAKLMLNDKVFCVLLPIKTATGFSKEFDLKDRLFGFLRSVKGIEVVVILTQISSTKVRLNMRSQGDVDVARLAQQFNGGGHKKAAGGMIEGSLSEAQQKILSSLKKTLKG